MQSTAGRLYDEARAALARQRTDQAARLLQAARTACGPGESPLRIRIDISWTWVTFEQRGLGAALAEIADVRRSARGLGVP